MNKTRSPQNLAKMLAYALGRRPDEFGLFPDGEGYVRIRELLKALHEETGWRYVNESHLREVLLTTPDPTFQIEARRIRSLRREAPAAEPASERPPKLLYAHVRRRAYAWVHANGIHPSAHPQVVLAAQRDQAERLGRRIDPDPVILTVNVHDAESHGVVFARFGDGWFLADQIPVGCFSGPPVPSDPAEEARKTRPRENESERPATPGSFMMDLERAAGSAVPESLKRRAQRGGKIDPKRLKRGKWSRDKPPWKKN